ncbi:MAG TPA: HEPN domain-containing protein [Syntrophaceae bacterium]|nr:HEPN domain-containing protein [Syntrophaceae bacterium]
MRNLTEVQRKLKDAAACLKASERDYAASDQNAQLCIELSAKAVISIYAEPLWTHDPSSQILKLMDEHKGEIIDKCGDEISQGLHNMIEDVGLAKDWHGWSVYGKEEGGVLYAAVDICTKEVAEDLLKGQKSPIKRLAKCLR